MNIPREKLMALTVEDLRALNEVIVEVIKEKRRRLAYQRGNELSVGQTVSFFSAKKSRQITGPIKAIKYTNCTVLEVSTGITWNVPMSMIPQTDKPAVVEGFGAF